MRLSGTIRTWHDDRGFGFIAPTHGGAELFVHISALPRDGSRPTVGEKLSYELGRGKDGRPQAVKVQREAIGTMAARPRALVSAPRRGGSWLTRIVGLALVAALGAYGYTRVQQQSLDVAPLLPPGPESLSQRQPLVTQPERNAPAATEANRYQCDGRTHCSQMSSCAEATFFLKHCPGTQMDGDGDGIPCEDQWCRRL